MASLSSGRPPAGVYRWFFGSRHGLDRGLDDVGRRREVGLAGPEADDGLAGRLEGLGLGVDGQRGRLGDGGDAPRHTGVGAGGGQRISLLARTRPRSVARVTAAPTPDIPIPADLLPADGRFGCGPSKVRPEAVDGAGRRRRATYLGTSHRQARVQFDGRRAAQRPGRAVRPARRLRGPARQRRHHRVLGRRHASGSSTSAASTCASASSRRSSPTAAAAAPAPRRARGHRRRAGHRTRCRWPTPTIDVYCLTHNETSTGVAMPLERPGGRRRALVLVDATSAAGGLRFDPARSTSTTSPRRSASPPTAACGSPPCSPAAIERIERIAASDRWVPAVARPRHRPRQLPQGPDLQHAGAGHDLPGRPAGRVDQRATAGSSGRRARCDRSADDHLRLGRGVATTPRRSSPTRRSAATSSPPSTSTPRRRRQRRLRRAARQRHRRHRVLPQARPQPAARRPVPRHRARRRRRPHPLHRPRRRGDARA